MISVNESGLSGVSNDSVRTSVVGSVGSDGPDGLDGSDLRSDSQKNTGQPTQDSTLSRAPVIPEQRCSGEPSDNSMDRESGIGIGDVSRIVPPPEGFERLGQRGVPQVPEVPEQLLIGSALDTLDNLRGNGIHNMRRRSVVVSESGSAALPYYSGCFSSCIVSSDSGSASTASPTLFNNMGVSFTSASASASASERQGNVTPLRPQPLPPPWLRAGVTNTKSF